MFTGRLRSRSVFTGLKLAALMLVTSASSANVAQAESTLVQIAFGYELNYQFVSTNAQASAQIFELLPRGLADGLGVAESELYVHSLAPLDTTNTLGYVTTAALVYVPSAAVDALQQQILDPSSPLYNHPDSRVASLLYQINSGIWITW